MSTEPDPTFVFSPEKVLLVANQAGRALLSQDPQLMGMLISLLASSQTNPVVHALQAGVRTDYCVGAQDLYDSQGVVLARSLTLQVARQPVAQAGSILNRLGSNPDDYNANIEEQIHLLSVALEAAANGIVITNAKGVIRWVNPAVLSLTGYSKEELLGNNPRVLKSGVHDEQFYKNIWNTICSGQTWHGEITNRKKDGVLYIEEQTIAPVIDQMGQVSHFIAIKSDITQRRKLENMQDDMLKTLVHDLRNPLNTILASLDIAENLNTSDEIAEILRISHIGARKMLGLVNSILDISQMESGSMPVNLEPVPLLPLVEFAFQFQSTLAGLKKLTLRSAIPSDLPPLLADKTLLSRIIQNLLDNAIKFSPGDSAVKISAAADDESNMVVIGVHDQGAGIPPQMNTHLFQKFASTIQSQRASGLGLAFCKLAVEAQGGKIWVESLPNSMTVYFSAPISERES